MYHMLPKLSENVEDNKSLLIHCYQKCSYSNYITIQIDYVTQTSVSNYRYVSLINCCAEVGMEHTLRIHVEYLGNIWQNLWKPL